MDFEKTLKFGAVVIFWALVAIYIANNVREVGNLVRPKQITTGS